VAKKEKDRDLFIMACISVINKDCIIDPIGEVCPQRIRERKKKRFSIGIDFCSNKKARVLKKMVDDSKT
jgi:hypothetical protein